GSSNFMSRATGVAAAVFFMSTLALAHFATQRTSASGGGLMERLTVPKTAPAPAVPATLPAAPAASAPAAPAPAAAAPAAPASPANQVPK
ncbi:MAG TPA: preprotein translocase subunit SecG, partial [Telluria sp.]|nr:preprotein translocase subunit SecG [Telluria sp.]